MLFVRRTARRTGYRVDVSLLSLMAVVPSRLVSTVHETEPLGRCKTHTVEGGCRPPVAVVGRNVQQRVGPSDCRGW
ncbi:hypothetical protein D8S78_10650 [Natrialba swarupiae]|nr:hypothetical protein [Natrialba swarupiae]